MFTPPPSPAPYPKSPYSDNVQESPPPAAVKRRIGSRTRWIAIIGPLILILVTISTHYVTHPAFFDILTNPADWDLPTSSWHPHKRHLSPLEERDTSNSTSTSSNGTSSSTSGSSTGTSSSTSATTTLAATAQAVPTIPTTASVPTPFPQPWDSALQLNFTTTSCYNFFNNMTNTTPFRSCRALSLLLQTSSALVLAQTNLTLLNSIIWGTCQPPIDVSQCSANMGWFADTLKTVCSEDLADSNAQVTQTLMGLQAYDLMYAAGCSSDPTTNSYCYLNAVHNSNPSDIYMYNVPLGIGLPTTSTPTCSTCTKNLMALYFQSLQNVTSAAQLSFLATSYPPAQSLVDQTCGSTYAKSITSEGQLGKSNPMAALTIMLLIVFVTMNWRTWSC